MFWDRSFPNMLQFFKVLGDSCFFISLSKHGKFLKNTGQDFETDVCVWRMTLAAHNILLATGNNAIVQLQSNLHHKLKRFSGFSNLYKLPHGVSFKLISRIAADVVRAKRKRNFQQLKLRKGFLLAALIRVIQTFRVEVQNKLRQTERNQAFRRLKLLLHYSCDILTKVFTDSYKQLINIGSQI